MLNPELVVTTRKRDHQVMRDSPPQSAAQTGAAAKNRQQKVEGHSWLERGSVPHVALALAPRMTWTER